MAQFQPFPLNLFCFHRTVVVGGELPFLALRRLERAA
jgi:hypothetical protein